MHRTELPSRRVLRVLTIAGILIIAACLALGYWSLQSDDAYIFYSYAKNLAHGNGYVFNVGQHVNATSSALYTLLLALVYWPFKSFSFELISLIGHIIGIIGLIGAAVFLMFGFERERVSVFPYIVPLVFLGSPFLAGTVGMELPVVLLCAAGALYFYLKDKQAMAGLALAMAVLARPDMIVFAGVVLVHSLLVKKRLPALPAIIIFAIPILLWLTFSWFYFGNLIPTTLSAKLAQSVSGLWGTGLVYFQGFAYGAYWYPEPPFAELMILPVALIGLIATAVQKKYRSVLAHPIIVITIIWNVLHLIVYGFILNAPAYEWYYAPFALGIAVLVAVGIRRVYFFFIDDLGSVPRIALSVIMVVMIAVAGAMPLRLANDDFPSIYYSYKATARWLNENAPQGSSVGANDIGILRFFYEKGPVICAAGLVNPDVIPHLRDRDLGWYLEEYKPDYLMFIIQPRGIMETMILNEQFKQRYELKVTYKHGWRTIGVYQRIAESS